METCLQEQVRTPWEVPGMTDLIEPVNLESSPDSDNPDDNVVLRLAFIGARWT